MLKDFKEFVARANVIDLAVGVIIGAALGKIVTSLVEGIIMPPIGLLLGKVDFASLFLVLDHSKGVPVSLADLGDPDFVLSMVVEKGALVFSLTDVDRPLRHLDIFLSPALSFERLSEGAVWFDIGPAKIRVVSKELLMKLKREIKPLRPKDVLDLEELVKTMKGPPP